MPSLIDLYDEFKDKGFEILAINVGEDPKMVKRFKASQLINFPVLLDPDHSVSTKYWVKSHPVHYLVDKQGNLHSTAVGYKNWSDRKNRKFIEELLK